MDVNVVEKSGAWYSYKKDRIGQGRDNVRAFLKENPSIAAAIEAEIRTAMGLKSESTANEPAAAEELAEA